MRTHISSTLQPVSSVELFNLHATALFVTNDAGRLRYVREPADEMSELPIAPRFFMGRTLEGNIWRFRDDLPAALVAELEQLCHAEPIAQTLHTPPANDALIRAALHAHAPITHEYRGPAYWVPETDRSANVAVVLNEVDQPVLAAHFAWKQISKPGFELGPTAAVVVDGVAVSLCFCSRIIGAVAEAGINTIDTERGKGYASAVAGVWAAAVRHSGRLPLYSTSWENLASQAVARHLGMVCYGEDWSID